MVSICAALAARHSRRTIGLLQLCCVFAGLMTVSASESPGFDARFEQWFVVQTNLQSWSANFIQTRSLRVLSSPLVSTGHVWVAADRFRWELGQPPQTIALRQSNQLMILYPKLKRAEKYALNDVPPGPIRDAMGLLDATMPRDRAAMEAQFRLLSAMETNATLQVVLEPKSAAARKFMGEILVAFRTNDFSMAVTELKFADGSALRNDFVDTKLNVPIPAAFFEMQVPPGYKTAEPLRQ